MKKILLVMLLLSFNAVSAELGGHLLDTKTKDRLALECLDVDCQEGVFILNEKAVDSSLVLNLADRTEFFYDFQQLLLVASTSRPPIPYSWYILNMQKVSKKLRKLFFTTIYNPDYKDQAVRMGHKNFLEVIKAIQNY